MKSKQSCTGIDDASNDFLSKDFVQGWGTSGLGPKCGLSIYSSILSLGHTPYFLLNVNLKLGMPANVTGTELLSYGLNA